MKNQNQKQKPFSLQLAGAFAILAIAASYLGYGLFQPSSAFEIPLLPPNIEITNPVGNENWALGEEWVVGETETISWELANVEWPATVTVLPILYYSPRGSDWVDQVLGFPASALGVETNSPTGLFEWKVGYELTGPGGDWVPMSIPGGDQYGWDEIKVAIEIYIGSTSGGASDRSGWFTIEDTQVSSVKLLPEGPLAIRTGETVQFTASAYNQNGVLLTDNPRDFVWDNATYLGVFNKTAVDRYAVAATYMDSEINDSAAVIVGPAIEITSPGGEDLILGDDTQTISWELAESLVTLPTRVFGSYVYRSKGTTGSGTPFASIWSETMYDVTESLGSFDWKVGYEYAETADTWKLIGLPNELNWDEVEIALRMNEERTYRDEGLPYDQSDWFIITPLPPSVEVTSPIRGEQWTIGDIKTISWNSDNIEPPASAILSLYYSSKETPELPQLMSRLVYPVGIVLTADTLSGSSFSWKVGYIFQKYDNTWESISLPDGYSWDDIDVFVEVMISGQDPLTSDYSELFTISEYTAEPQPLFGTYYSADIELSEPIGSLTSANVNWGFVEGFGLDPNGSDGSGNIAVAIAFKDASGNYILLEGGGTGMEELFYMIYTNATVDPDLYNISRLNIASNLSDAVAVQFSIFLGTHDWNVTQPYLESLSVSYDSVVPTDDPFTITVTPQSNVTGTGTVAPGWPATYFVAIDKNDETFEFTNWSIDVDMSQFGTDIINYTFEELSFIPEDPHPYMAYLLTVEVASEDDLIHLDETGLTFTVTGTTDTATVTSSPVDLLITTTDQDFVIINFTATLQIGETESPVYRPNPEFAFHIYEVNADQYSKVVTVTVPDGTLGVTEDGEYFGSVYVTELQAGFTYAVFAKTSQHISRRAVEDITTPDPLIGSETFDIIFLELLAGDIGGGYDVFGNRDDSINSNDFGIFSELFQKPIDEGFWSIADFNNDGSVNVNDFWPFGETGNFQEMGDLGQILSNL